MSAALRWGGLDFDTSELDGELRAALNRAAPADGAVVALRTGATPKEAQAAARADAVSLRCRRADELGGDLEDNTPEDQALDALADACEALERARAALWEAHEDLRRAQRLLAMHP